MGGGGALARMYQGILGHNFAIIEQSIKYQFNGPASKISLTPTDSIYNNILVVIFTFKWHNLVTYTS